MFIGMCGWVFLLLVLDNEFMLVINGLLGEGRGY